MKRQGKLNMHIIFFENVLMLFTKISKLVNDG